MLNFSISKNNVFYNSPFHENEEAVHLRSAINRELGTYVEGLAREAEDMLMNYDWPGNVRELRNMLERAINDRMSGVLTGENIQSQLKRRRHVQTAQHLKKGGPYK